MVSDHSGQAWGQGMKCRTGFLTQAKVRAEDRVLFGLKSTLLDHGLAGGPVSSFVPFPSSNAKGRQPGMSSAMIIMMET